MGAGGRLEVYVDVASFYSYVAVVQILQNIDVLTKQHGVEVEILPCFIGAISNGSGNKPPWTVPAKAKQLGKDMRRAIRTVGMPPSTSSPGDLMVLGRTVLPMRALWFIKDSYPAATFHTALHHLFRCFYVEHLNLTGVEGFAKALAACPVDIPVRWEDELTEQKQGVKEKKLLFTEDQVRDIVAKAGTQEYKDKLKKSVDDALGRGAFGAPWLWVTPPPSSDGEQGKAEAFFGSDRWHHVYELLGLPYTDVKLLRPGEEVLRVSKL